MIWTPFLLHRGPILNFDEDEIIKSFLWNLLPFQDFTTVTPYHTSSSTKDLRYLMVSKDIHSHFSSAIGVLKIGKTKNTMFPVRITNAKMRISISIFRQFDVILYCLAYECFDLTIYFLLEIFRQFDVIFRCLAYGYFELTKN